jgi:hypothetical protein
MRKPGPDGIALVPVAKACPLAVGLESPATVGPCRGCRLAHRVRLAIQENLERGRVKKDTP